MLRPQFRAVRTGQRYLREDVDALVARVLATAERRADGTEITVDELRNAAFMTPPLLVVGYSAEDVDSFLDEAERWLPGHRNIQSAVPATPLGPIGERVAPRFTPVRWREGYDVTEVDAFVDRVMATVNGWPVERPVTAGEIRTIQFSPVRMSEGYDVEEVDAFLDTAVEWLSGPR